MPASVPEETTMMVRLFLVLFLGAFAALSVLSCQQTASVSTAPHEVASVVVAVDVSASAGDATKSSLTELRCAEVAGIVQRRLLQNKRVDVLVLATGSKATGYEPRIISPWLRFAPTFRQFGRAASPATQAEAFLTSLVERCRGTLATEGISPIVFTVSRGALSLESHCTDLAAHREVCASRELVVVSDLRENVQAAVRERLLAASKALRLGKPLPTRPPTLPTISLHGNLLLCGLSEHVAGSDDLAVLPEAVVMVWRELFDRDVVFEAACPRLPLPSTPNEKISGVSR